MRYIALFLAFLLMLFFLLLASGKLDFIPRYVKKQLALPFLLKDDDDE